MRKVVAAINMTLDGFCDHTAGFFADDELHYHYANLLNNAGVLLYGRITYQLMQFWQTLLKTPSEKKSMNDFAISIDKIEKHVFSNTLKETGWDTAKLINRPLDEEVLELKQRSGKDIFIGSRSLIIQLLNSDLIDEFQICIHPVIEGKGLPLFEQIKSRIFFKLIKTKSLNSGATVLYYKPTSEKTMDR
jgi:dihydrofolate reductase